MGLVRVNGGAGSKSAESLLVVNTGSSSVKLAVLDPTGTVTAETQVEGWDGVDVEPIRSFVAEAPEVVAAGHRVVHGGADLRSATIIDDRSIARMEATVALAPLHQPRALAAIRAAQGVLPGVPHVACFDTSYHADMPAAASTYALPAEWRERWPLRRFGFHGLSHAHAARRATKLVDSTSDKIRVVSCHLGAGASLCASIGTQSVDTTMGFTPLDGLVMQTRSGALDPGLVVWLCTQAGLEPAEVGEVLERRSGLAALAGGTGDMREVISARARGDRRATLAFDVYIHRIRREIAAMTASLSGLDVIVFTGGVGEHIAEVREAAADGLGHLGITLDSTRNLAARGAGDHDLTAPGASVRTLVVEAREDLEIARQTRTALLATGVQPPDQS